MEVTDSVKLHRVSVKHYQAHTAYIVLGKNGQDLQLEQMMKK